MQPGGLAGDAPRGHGPVMTDSGTPADPTPEPEPETPKAETPPKAAKQSSVKDRVSALPTKWGAGRTAIAVGAVVGALALVVGAGFFVADQVGGDSPEDVTKSFFTAVVDKDPDKAEGMLCEKFKKDFSASGMVDAGVTDFTITKSEGGGESATVTAETISDGGGQKVKFGWKVVLVKEDGYKVCGLEPTGNPTVVQ